MKIPASTTVQFLLKRARGHLKGTTIPSPDLAEVIAVLNCYSLIKKVIKHTKLACLHRNCHHVWYVHLPRCRAFCLSVPHFFDLKTSSQGKRVYNLTVTGNYLQKY